MVPHAARNIEMPVHNRDEQAQGQATEGKKCVTCRDAFLLDGQETGANEMALKAMLEFDMYDKDASFLQTGYGSARHAGWPMLGAVESLRFACGLNDFTSSRLRLMRWACDAGLSNDGTDHHRDP